MVYYNNTYSPIVNYFVYIFIYNILINRLTHTIINSILFYLLIYLFNLDKYKMEELIIFNNIIVNLKFKISFS